MVRRRLILGLVALLGFGAIAMVPAASGANSSSNTKGNGPKEQRCDPQPTHGNGPPPGKGKKCASP
jgi:hypothetical protein